MKTLLALLGILAAMSWLPVASYLYWVCRMNIVASFAIGFLLGLLATSLLFVQWFVVDYIQKYCQKHTSARSH